MVQLRAAASGSPKKSTLSGVRSAGGIGLHLPWSIPTNLLVTFIVSLAAERYRSALIGIFMHSVQTIVFTALLLTLVFR